MKITDIKLYTLRSGETGERGAAQGESQYCGGGWAVNSLISCPMSVYPKYRRVRTLWMGPGQDPYVVEILTDEGVSGFAANYGGGPFACAVIDQHFRRFLIGQDPFNIELIWDQMNRATLPYGLGGVVGMAISGVDLALWDLVAKALKQPVYKIAGGETKEEIPCYVTTHPDCASPWKDRGFLGVKIAAPWGVESGREGIVKTARLVEKLRRELGDDMELMIDCYLSWDIEFTTRVVERIREYDVKWVEDPLQNGWAAEQNRYLRERISPVQVATGNLEFHYKAFHAILVNQATDVIQPELQWCGGLTAVRRIAAMAKPYDIPVIPHSSGPYDYHFTMSNTNSPFAEYLARAEGTEVLPTSNALEDEPVPVNGKIRLDPTKPGFGVELKRGLLVPYPAR